MADFHLNGNFQQITIDPTAHVELGQDITLRSFVCLEVGNGATLKLGNRVFFNNHCSIRCEHHIEIGKDTMFGDGVRIFDHNHQYSNYHVEKIAFNYGKISIGKNCWIGANVVVPSPTIPHVFPVSSWNTFEKCEKIGHFAYSPDLT